MSGVVLRPPARVALFVTLQATLLWAGVVLIGWGVGYGLLGGVVGIGIAALATDRTVRAQERAARTAVREHRDPGPALRAEADAQARRLLAAPAVDRWGPPVVLLGVATACVGTAIVRGDWAGGLPAGALIGFVPVVVVLRRRAEAAATRWLTDPPVPAAEEVDR